MCSSDLSAGVRATLGESLDRLGAVVTGDGRPGSPAVEDRWIRAIEVLAGGGTAATAADAAAVSPRTLYRTLSELRDRFGVTSNTELVSRLVVDDRAR